MKKIKYEEEEQQHQIDNKEMKTWYDLTTRSQALDAVPEARFKDAITSFEYMLLSEGISILTQDKLNSLIYGKKKYLYVITYAFCKKIVLNYYFLFSN
jgi:hypothetical protein